MTKQNNNTGKVEKRFEIVAMVFVPHHQSTVILQPGEQSFNFPPPLVAPQRPSVLRLAPLLAVWRDHFDSSLFKPLIKRVRVVGFVADQALWVFVEEARVERLLNQLGLVRRSTLDAYGDRKTIAVCHCHDLGALAALGFADVRPPFFAGAKLPSMKHSLMSKPPRWRRSLAKAWRISKKTPSLTHCWKRRWQVARGG
jgi:hypothetical protein